MKDIEVCVKHDVEQDLIESLKERIVELEKKVQNLEESKLRVLFVYLRCVLYNVEHIKYVTTDDRFVIYFKTRSMIIINRNLVEMYYETDMNGEAFRRFIAKCR